MEVNSQLHAPGLFSPRMKIPLYPLSRRQVRLQSWSGRSGKEKRSQSLPWIKPLSSSPYPSYYTNWATPAPGRIGSIKCKDYRIEFLMSPMRATCPVHLPQVLQRTWLVMLALTCIVYDGACHYQYRYSPLLPPARRVYTWLWQLIVTA
jgi:hypothetical protein